MKEAKIQIMKNLQKKIKADSKYLPLLVLRIGYTDAVFLGILLLIVNWKL